MFSTSGSPIIAHLRLSPADAGAVGLVPLLLRLPLVVRAHLRLAAAAAGAGRLLRRRHPAGVSSNRAAGTLFVNPEHRPFPVGALHDRCELERTGKLLFTL